MPGYIAVITHTDNSYHVHFPDFPSLTTTASSMATARTWAAGYLRRGRAAGNGAGLRSWQHPYQAPAGFLARRPAAFPWLRHLWTTPSRWPTAPVS
jgi:hypothetical protein